MGRLLLFIALPALELALLIEIGARIGTANTVALIVVTGIVGASLARSQGLRVLSRVREELGAGRVPGDAIVDALMILIASALLVTPGVLTDVFGFLCLVPAAREQVKRRLRRRFEQAVAEGHVHVAMHTPGAPPHGFGAPRTPDDEMIDVTPKKTPEP